ncbi:nucleobindin-2 isoform X2 [Anabrus simplex]|uniref:nucleobindin-2 isoform X2 n=1 Tax=Anabrus simplex TaxID=316456 RepID=UPI0035A3955A
MKTKIILLVFMVILQGAIGPPVNQKKKSDEDDNNNEENEINENEQLGSLGIEYNRYLKEVVTALESDPEFREKLEKAEDVDIRTGKIAQELDYVNHNIRTKLDELKRQELERLRHLASKEYELKNGIDTEHLKIAPEHIDHSNPHTFEIEDLRKLIAKTTADLAEADKKRRQEFKEYEMLKEYEKQQKLKTADEENRKKLEEELKEQENKHKKHEPLHHPGSKQQLQEVWEKQDHMENQEFDPKTFFYLHDLDGNGVWDESEVKALFLKELDKLYQAGAPEDDMRERVEEMERMREHVFSEADTNHDKLISFQEFLAQTQKPDFTKDQGWQGLDQQQVYTQEEYHEFERRRNEEVQRLIDQGLIPPYPNIPQQYGYHAGLPPQQFQQPQHRCQGARI